MEGRSRGRGAAPGSVDITSTSATVASDETPFVWPDFTTADETVVEEPKTVDDINGTPHDDPAPFTWGEETVVPPPSTVNGASKKPPVSAPAPTPSRQSRIVDPSAKFSWASIVKPATPPPPPPPPKPQTPLKPVYQPPPPKTASRPSTRGHDVIEEPAQTIHDPFLTEIITNKPKVQLPQPAFPQPALPHIPQPKLPHPEPLTSRNLDLLEDQQPTSVVDPTPSVAAHRSSPTPKGDGPPGLPRFPRNREITPVVMPGHLNQGLGGMQLQFG
jgi:hypothetical protein